MQSDLIQNRLPGLFGDVKNILITSQIYVKSIQIVYCSELRLIPSHEESVAL